MAFARDPIERLSAVSGHEQRDFPGRGFGDEVGAQQFAVTPADGREASAMGLAYHFAVLSKYLATLFGIDIKGRELHWLVAESLPQEQADARRRLGGMQGMVQGKGDGGGA